VAAGRLQAWAVWSMRRRLASRGFSCRRSPRSRPVRRRVHGPPQDVNLLALLAPLALLASQGVADAATRAAAALDWFGVITFAFFGRADLAGVYGNDDGVPPREPQLCARRARVQPEFNVFYFLFAVVLTLAWF